MEHVIMMHAKDNIAIVMAPSLAVGSEFTVGGKMVCAKDELPFAHKVAIKAIPKGGQIVKYGEPVGISPPASTFTCITSSAVATP